MQHLRLDIEVRYQTDFYYVKCQVTKSPRLYMLVRTAMPSILLVTRLPFVCLCCGWVVQSLSPHIKALSGTISNYVLELRGDHSNWFTTYGPHFEGL